MPEASGPALAFSNGETVFVTARSLNAREEPSTDAPIATSISRGTSVEVVDRSGEWLKIVQGGVMLWIAAKHVSSSPPTSPNIEPQSLTGVSQIPARKVSKPEQQSISAFYPNCSAVRAAGAAPLYRGQPGYSRKLDRDGDGKACE
jgi:hypothetical protein